MTDKDKKVLFKRLYGLETDRRYIKRAVRNHCCDELTLARLMGQICELRWLFEMLGFTKEYEEYATKTRRKEITIIRRDAHFNIKEVKPNEKSNRSDYGGYDGGDACRLWERS